MPLSDTTIKAAKPNSDKDYKLADGGSLFLIISKSGGKLWRFRYWFMGTEKMLSLGIYPEVGLKDARGRRDEAKKVLANSVDPSFEKKRQVIAASIQANNTFKGVAKEYIEKLGHGFRSAASTLLNESAEWQPDAIEAALAHQDKNKVRGSYNRGQYWSERVAMAQWWSDYPDKLREDSFTTQRVA